MYCASIAGSTSIPTDTKKTAPNRSLTGAMTFSMLSACTVPARIDPMMNAPSADENPA